MDNIKANSPSKWANYYGQAWLVTVEPTALEDSGIFCDLNWIPKHMEDPILVDKKLCYPQIIILAEILLATKASLYLEYASILRASSLALLGRKGPMALPSEITDIRCPSHLVFLVG